MKNIPFSKKEFVFVMIVVLLTTIVSTTALYSYYSNNVSLAPSWISSGWTATKAPGPYTKATFVPFPTWKLKWEYYPEQMNPLSAGGSAPWLNPSGRNIALGNNDDNIFIKRSSGSIVGVLSTPRILFDVNSPIPLWESNPVVPNMVTEFEFPSQEALSSVSAAAKNSDIFAVIVAQEIQSQFFNEYYYRLEVYDSAGFLWDYVFSSSAPSGNSPKRISLKISDDGSKIIGIVEKNTFSPDRFDLAIFDVNSQTPNIPTFTTSLQSSIFGTEISQDLSSVMVGGSSPLFSHVYDVSTNTYSNYFASQFSLSDNFQDIAISDDGSRVALSSSAGPLGKVLVYEKQGTNYILIHNYPLPGHFSSEMARTMKFSTNGDLLVLGVSKGLIGDDFYVEAIDLSSSGIGNILFTDIYVGAGTGNNFVNAIDISLNGKIIAVGNLGDTLGSTSEILIYDLNSLQANKLVFSYDVSSSYGAGYGSIVNLDLNDAGDLLVASNYWGNLVSGTGPSTGVVAFEYN